MWTCTFAHTFTFLMLLMCLFVCMLLSGYISFQTIGLTLIFLVRHLSQKYILSFFLICKCSSLMILDSIISDEKLVVNFIIAPLHVMSHSYFADFKIFVFFFAFQLCLDVDIFVSFPFRIHEASWSVYNIYSNFRNIQAILSQIFFCLFFFHHKNFSMHMCRHDPLDSEAQLVSLLSLLSLLCRQRCLHLSAFEFTDYFSAVLISMLDSTEI